MRKLLLAICVLFSHFLLAQDEEKKKKEPLKPDSNYIVSYPDLITVGLFSAAPVMQLKIKPVDDHLEKYESDFRGNFSDQVGFSFAYKKISFQFGFKTPFGSDFDDRKGRTSTTGIAIKVRKPNISYTVEYRRYRGYYDNNSPDYIPRTDTVLVRPDVRYYNVGVNGIYNFSWKKYSYNAPLTYADRQLKSRIGFLAKAGLNYTTISSSDSTLLSSVQTNRFVAFDDVRSINAVLLKAGPGIGGTLVIFKRFYISGNYFFMGNLIGYTYDIEGEDRSPWHLNTNFYTESSIGAGYNSKRLYAGLSLNGDLNVMRIRDARIQTNFATLLITAGYRFDPPPFLKKAYKKIPFINKKKSVGG